MKLLYFLAILRGLKNKQKSGWEGTGVMIGMWLGGVE
jgi:hypothetical protein